MMKKTKLIRSCVNFRLCCIFIVSDVTSIYQCFFKNI